MAHLALRYSRLEIIYTLYMKGVLQYDPEDPDWKDRDRFNLSKGHGELALYSVLMENEFFGEKKCVLMAGMKVLAQK